MKNTLISLIIILIVSTTAFSATKKIQLHSKEALSKLNKKELVDFGHNIYRKLEKLKEKYNSDILFFHKQNKKLKNRAQTLNGLLHRGKTKQQIKHEAQNKQETWASYLHTPLQITNNIGMTLVFIPPGTFMEGSPPEENNRGKDETQRQVTISKGFYIGATQVTQKQWQAVMGKNPTHGTKGANYPVTWMTWYKAKKFCRKLSKMTGRHYHLPTEAQWEYAYRAGTTTAYYWGNSARKIDKYAWYKGNSKTHLHKVAQKLPNNWGLYDMAGNVDEWSNDVYGSRNSKFIIDPTGSTKDKLRVVKGGSRFNKHYTCRAATRIRHSANHMFNYIGLRVVMDLPTKKATAKNSTKVNNKISHNLKILSSLKITLLLAVYDK